MHLKKALCSVVLAAALLAPTAAFAKAKSYQVTGPVLSIEKGVVTVQKGDEKWEIDLADAKVEGKLEVGQKVTIHYHMVADKVDQKEEK